MTTRLENRIDRVRVSNYCSLADVDVTLEDLTVLIGPNGSGKSNFLDVLRFVSDALKFGLDVALMSHERGGITLLRRHSTHKPFDVTINIDVTIARQQGRYSFTLGTKSKADGEVLVKSETCTFGAQSFVAKNGELEPDSVDDGVVGLSNRLRLSALANREPYEPIFRFLSNIGFYSIFPNVLRSPQRPGSASELAGNAENLASVLRELTKQGEWREELYKALARIVPGLASANTITVKPTGSYLVVRLKHEEGHSFDLALESDGTLRTLGILTALYQDRVPSLIGLEEPELMIHVGALQTLCEVLQEVSSRTQIIVTTHSPDMISVFDPRSFRIVERQDGVTHISLPSEAALQTLNDNLFSSGDLLRIGGLRRD